MIPIAPLCLATANPEAPGIVFFLIFPLIWLGASALGNFMLGIYGLFREFPADPSDTIEESFGWVQVNFGNFRGHTPMGLRLGRGALHLKGVFPFQPLFWLGPASIPWSKVVQIQRLSENWWQFWSAAEFNLGTRKIRLRGRAGRALQARLDANSSQVPRAIVPR